MGSRTVESADDIRINGSGTYRHDIQAKHVHIAGHGRFEGNVQADIFKSSGSCHVNGHCHAEELLISGHGHFRSVTANQIHFSGSLRVNQSIETGEFHAKGSVTVGDTLTAEEVHIRLHGVTSIGQIVAERKITIGTDRKSILNWLSLGRKKAICSTLKGRRVEVNHLEAELIIGEEVYIGPNCKIGEVQYSKRFTIDPTSVVERMLQI